MKWIRIELRGRLRMLYNQKQLELKEVSSTIIRAPRKILDSYITADARSAIVDWCLSHIHWREPINWELFNAIIFLACVHYTDKSREAGRIIILRRWLWAHSHKAAKILPRWGWTPLPHHFISIPHDNNGFWYRAVCRPYKWRPFVLDLPRCSRGTAASTLWACLLFILYSRLAHTLQQLSWGSPSPLAQWPKTHLPLHEKWFGRAENQMR